MIALRLLETLHGHLGMLAAAALIHPALILRRGQPPSRGAQLFVVLSTAAVVLTFATGLYIYADYRHQVRAALFHQSVTAGMLFETKEHLAYAVLATAASGCVSMLAAPREARGLRRAAAIFYALSAALCLLTVGLGSYVAAVSGFGSHP